MCFASRTDPDGDRWWATVPCAARQLQHQNHVRGLCFSPPLSGLLRFAFLLLYQVSCSGRPRHQGCGGGHCRRPDGICSCLHIQRSVANSRMLESSSEQVAHVVCSRAMCSSDCHVGNGLPDAGRLDQQGLLDARRHPNHDHGQRLRQLDQPRGQGLHWRRAVHQRDHAHATHCPAMHHAGGIR